MTARIEPEIWEQGPAVHDQAGGEVHLQVRSDLVAVIQFARPPYNYFDRGLIAALADAYAHAFHEGARAVVLCSKGKAFCAGADFGATKGPDLHPSLLYEEGLRLFRQPLPTVVAIHGAAVGGGVGLALTGDFRVAAHEAKLAVNFAGLGIHPGFGISVTLPDLVGRQVATELLFTGRRIDGTRAESVGLVDHAVPKDDVFDTAIGLAREIARSAPLAVRSVRSTLRAALVEKVAAALVHECAEQESLFRTKDFREGVTAVRERRIARFEGA